MEGGPQIGEAVTRKLCCDFSVPCTSQSWHKYTLDEYIDPQKCILKAMCLVASEMYA